MIVTISEDLNSSPRGRTRFCATVEGDSNPERGGFGRTEQSALWSLAQQLGIHPATLQVTATIERLAVR
jgi:hypothetical protein